MSVCRIVLIEDNPADVVLLREALNYHGVKCELEQYSNGEDAANAITAMLDAPALFLVDLNIPRLHGLELLRIIRACPIFDEVPAVILTSSRNPSDKSESERLGADAYIVKSPGYQEFLTTVGGPIVRLLQRKSRGGSGGRLRGRLCGRLSGKLSGRLPKRRSGPSKLRQRIMRKYGN